MQMSVYAGGGFEGVKNATGGGASGVYSTSPTGKTSKKRFYKILLAIYHTARGFGWGSGLT